MHGPTDGAMLSPRQKLIQQQELPMPFAIRNLSVLAYAQGFTLWHYRGLAGNLSDVSQPGFFDPASDMLASGDMILCSASDGGCIVVVATLKPGVRVTGLGAPSPATTDRIAEGEGV